MKVFFTLFLLINYSFCFAADGPLAQRRVFKFPAGVTAADYLPDKVIVKFRPDSSGAFSIKTLGNVHKLQLKSVSITGVKQIFANSNAEVSATGRQKPDDGGLDRIFELTFTGKKPVDQVINEILINPNVDYAEPSYIYYSQYTPNDAFFESRQGYLNQIRSTQAWDVIRNSANVVIAIVDSGSDLEHPDLAANIFLNQADPVNGIDDDRDGYIDNYTGWDFIGLSAGSIKEDNNPDVTSDSTDHGVHVSGIASAVSDNLIGVASTAFNAKLLIVKVGADNNSRAIYRGYEGIKYAADHGAQIINCSWGGPGGGNFGQEIINYALSKGVLIVAAAGNDNTDLPDFPASYGGVMSVASVNSTDIKSSFSNFGPTVDLAAPGATIYNTRNGGTYGNRSGTSMSSPMAASAAALVKARFPNFNMLQVGEQLRVTADNIDSENPDFVGLLGKGRINVLRAVTEASPSIRNQKITIVDRNNGALAANDTMRLFFDIRNFLAPATGLVLNLSSTNTDVEIIDGQLNVGGLSTLETKNAVGPFRVFIKPGVSDNEEVEFRLSYTSNGGNYRDFEIFKITVSLDYLNIEVNKVSSTITSNGRVGYNSPEATNGLGFVYKGQSLLYEASLMIGNASNRVSNNARNDAGDSDNHFVKQVRVSRAQNPDATFEARSEFNDSRSPSPLSLYVRHRQLAYSEVPDDKYTLVEYDIQNNNATPLVGVYVGLYTDWDIDESGRDITKYDAVNRMGYVYGRTAGTKYAAVKLLKNTAAPAYYPLTYQVSGDLLETGGGFSLSEKYLTLSSGIKTNSLGDSPANGYDVSFVIGSGPYTIPANGAVKVAFAFIGGDNLEDLQASAVAAENKYNTLLNQSVSPSEGFVLKQNYPNPAVNSTTIEFSIPKEAVTSISLYNVVGKRVREVLNENLRQGLYRINVDLGGLKSGVYFYRMSYENKSRTMKMLIVR